jgi:uncharacterized protein (DUF362 family)
MDMGRVAVVKVGASLGEALDRGLELIGGLGLKGGEEVVVKPNICNSKNPYGMVLTDIRLIEEVIARIRPLAGRVTVVESDNIDGPAEKRLRDSGLMGKLEELDVEFINLTRDDFEVHTVAGREIQIPKTVLEADYFVNMPKIKTCGPTLVTLSIKNLFGVIPTPKKSRLHGLLDEILPYLAKVIRHDLIVVDGIVGMEGNGPVIGNPRPLGLIVLGRNPVEVDSLITCLMGFKPEEVNHIVRAHKLGAGEMSLEGIEVLGDDWRGIKPFERPYTIKASIRCLKSIGKMYLP